MKSHEFSSLIKTLYNQYYKLIIIAGGTHNERTSYLKSLSSNEQHINLNLYMSTKLLDVPVKKRSLMALDILNQLLVDFEKDILYIDHIELLFLPELKLDPLKALQNLSRNKTLVISWPGEYKENALIYAEPWHPEYRAYNDLKEISKIISI